MKQKEQEKLKRNATIQSSIHSQRASPLNSENEDSIGDFCSSDTTRLETKNVRRRDTSNDNIIRPRDLPSFLGISKTTCWRLSKDPSSGFPQKIFLSKGAVGFLRHQLLEYLESRQAV